MNDLNKDLKLECLVEGYEGTYFEIGQVWETRGGEKLKVIGFDFETRVYKLTLIEVEDPSAECYYTTNGRFQQEWESEFDLVKLITTETPSERLPTEEPKPKTLSEYLKENKAYNSFIENCVASFLKDLNWLKDFKTENQIITLGNTFIWDDSKESKGYWENLNTNIPAHIEYDMNEVIFTEVDKRVAEYLPKTKYMVFVEGRGNPVKVHSSYESAEEEAKRIAEKEFGCNVNVLSIVKTFKSKVIVEEVK